MVRYQCSELTFSLSGPCILSPNSHRRDDNCTDVVTATPIIIPNDDARYIPPVAIAICSCSSDAVKAIKIPDPTTPIPKPPGNVSSTSQAEILPCQRTISSTYEVQDTNVASTIRFLYFPVRRIRCPARTPPNAFPNTGGKRYAPARVLLALIVARK